MDSKDIPAGVDQLDDDDDEHDDLDELIAEITKQTPDFPALLEKARQERIAARARGEDPNDIPWDDDEEVEQGAASPPPAAPQQS